MFLCLALLILTTVFGDAAKHGNVNLNRIPKTQSRIVGGQDGTILDIPFQIAMIYSGFFLCGGTIVGPTFVITAAHCTYGRTANNTKIKAGSSFLYTGGFFFQVESFANHPKYNNETLNYDLAILILEEALPTTMPEIQPIQLPERDEPIANNAIARVSGWGSSKLGGEPQKTLQYVDVPVVKLTICRTLYVTRGLLITKQMVCAGNIITGGKGACQGDSGGPMVINDKLFGAVSFGVDCGNILIPQVYASIANNLMRDWIKLIIGY